MTREGMNPSLNAIATRNTIRIIEEPFLALIAMACTRKRRQRIGDLFASTTVGHAGFLTPPGLSPRLAIYPAVWAVTGALVLLGTSEFDGSSSSGHQLPPATGYAPQSGDDEIADGVDFAEAVSRTCVYNVDRGMSAQRKIQANEDATQEQIQARLHHSWSDFLRSTSMLTANREAPAEDADAFSAWRANLLRQVDLYQQAGDAWANGGGGAAALSAEIGDLRHRQAELARQLGFSPCVPTGPGRQAT